jgi:hypothetical protein
MELIDSVTVNSSGQFIFNNISDDTMQVYAYSNTGNCIGTYYRASGDTCAWIPGDSSIIYCGTMNMNIVLDELIPMSGSGTVSGQIVQGLSFGKLNMAQLSPGGPVGGIDVGVRKKPSGTIVAMTQTDAAGNYSIGNIDPGNYSLYVDIPGLPMDSTYDFSVTNNETFGNLNFVADSSSIYLNSGVGTHQSTFTEQPINVFPNPSDGAFTVAIKNTQATTIILLDLQGRELHKQESKCGGSILFSQTNLAEGVYLLKIVSADKFVTQRIVINH